MKDLIKIGYSTKDPNIRARELANTGVPHKYDVIYDALVDNPYKVEQLVHSDLHKFNEDKEWFKCSVQEGINSIRKNAEKIHQESVEGESATYEKINSISKRCIYSYYDNDGCSHTGIKEFRGELLCENHYKKLKKKRFDNLRNDVEKVNFENEKNK
jgi:hypothetical protein